MDSVTLEKIDKLEQQKQKYQARIEQLKKRYQQNIKKAETRRKLLIGEYFLDKYQQENNLNKLYQELYHYVTRENDKKLFKTEESGN